MQQILRLKLSQIYHPVPTPAENECWKMNLEIFSSFRELQLLDFSGNDACLQNLEGLRRLSKLKYLDLSHNFFQEGIKGSVGKLVSLEVLNLNGNDLFEALHKTDFGNLHNLRELHLGSNQLSGSLPAYIFTLPCLEYLDLSDNLFDGHIPINLSWSLQILDLGYNRLSGRIPVSVFALPSLEYLDLYGNHFQGHVPINSSQNLRELRLGFNQLSGSLPASLFSLPCLEYLDLSDNLFQGHIPVNSSWKCSSMLQSIKLSGNMLSGKFDFFWLRNSTKLKEIYLSRNTDLVVQVKLNGWVPNFQLRNLMLSWCNLDKSMIAEPHFLRTQHHLRFLDLSNNNLPGSMPIWLFTYEMSLVYMDLSNNSLVGSLDPILQHQTNLQLLNISLNHVEGQLPASIGFIFPNLEILDVSRNAISGTIPLSLCKIGRIRLLDLSNNKFTGEVPSCLFSSCIELTILKLSVNSLRGKILGGASNLSNLWEVYLDNNNFEGTLPGNLTGNSVVVMDLHNNKLSGELDTSFWNLSALEALSLASNALTGDIRPGICTLTSLQMLDLSNNYFAGRTPNCSVLLILRFLSVSGNTLSGIPDAFYDSAYIVDLDLSQNQFTGNLQWTQHLYNINVLLLSRNKFEGPISSNMCHLQQLSIIDISDNMLSGSIPPCIGGISFQYPYDYSYEWPTTSGGLFIERPDGMVYWYSSNYDLQGFTFTTKGNRYTYGPDFFLSMSGIDLSANILSGEIPQEIGNLSHIKSLNLFTGSIPATFANLSAIESLDLSENRLNGSIPRQLTRLSALEVFSVAFNNLSGCLPDSGQFGSFDMESYKGNNNLRSCTSSSGPVAPNGAVGSVPDDSDPILSVVTAVSYVMAFWATVTFVFCHPFGRRIVLKL